MNILFHPHQQYVFLGMLVAGIIAGIVFDAFSVKRMFLGAGYIACFIDDVLFSFIACVIFAAGTFVTNSGVIRWYGVLSFALGFTLYKLTVSRAVTGFFRLILRFIKKCLRALLRAVVVICEPFAAIVRALARYVSKAAAPVKNVLYEKIVLYKIFKSYKNMHRTGKW